MYRSPIESEGCVETAAVPGGFSTIIRDHHGHQIEPEPGRGYFDGTMTEAMIRHDTLVAQRLAVVTAVEVGVDGSDD